MQPAEEAAGLKGCDGPLFQQSQRILLDLDGVVILDEAAIPGAVGAVDALRRARIELRFVTNNASRPPAAVAALLARAGISADPSEITTSAIAAAALLAERHPPGSRVLVVGGEGVHAALSGSGLSPVTTADAEPVAVIQGFAPEVDWAMLAEAAVAIRAGAEWVATNTDRTLPSPRGPLPGNGSLVAALVTATGREPVSVGKPQRALYDAALDGIAADEALVVGDRLDTDIAGARTAEIRSLLVLTGVSGARDLIDAPPAARPDFIGRDLGALHLAHPAATVTGNAGRSGASSATVEAGAIELLGRGGTDGLDGLRALCALAWSSAGAAATPEAYVKALGRLDLN